MQFKRSTNKKTQDNINEVPDVWEPYFAWIPTRFPSRWVWLEKIEINRKLRKKRLYVGGIELTCYRKDCGL